jgi:hypothetical protein
MHHKLTVKPSALRLDPRAQPGCLWGEWVECICAGLTEDAWIQEALCAHMHGLTPTARAAPPSLRALCGMNLTVPFRWPRRNDNIK